MNIDIFSNQTFLESIDYLFQFIQTKPAILKDLMFENVIYQKVQSNRVSWAIRKKTLTNNAIPFVRDNLPGLVSNLTSSTIN